MEQTKYDVFISYSRRDYVDDAGNALPNNMLTLIKDAFKANGISYWFDEEGIYSGDEFASVLTNAIRNSRIFLFVSSVNSNQSKWTSNEISTALAYNMPIIPFRLDDSPYNDSVMMKIVSFDFIECKNANRDIKKLLRAVKHHLSVCGKVQDRSVAAESEKARTVNNKGVRSENPIHKKQMRLWSTVAGMALVLIAIGTFIFYNKGKASDDFYAAVDEAQGMFTVNGVTFKMICVEGGTFTMGATNEQSGEADADEKPSHQVTLPKYYIGETEVTQALWQAVMKENPSDTKGVDLPVESVSWEDCQRFIVKLNQLTGSRFRMPTEAEWEFAARGGMKSRGSKYSGSDNINDVGWYKENSDSESRPVKTKWPNELGIYDMSGNVSEWCQDWKDDYSGASQNKPQGPKMGSERVYRGGGWFDKVENCRVSYRDSDSPDYCDDDLGLRLAL